MAKHKKWFRISEWWNSKVVSLMGLAYFFILIDTANPQSHITDLSFLFIWMVFSAALGYYINDVYDNKHDAISGKYNYSAKHSPVMQTVIASILIVAIWLDWHFLNNEELVGVLLATQIMLFFLYSSPFLRLKENPILGVVVDSLYAHLIPGIIVYFTILSSVESPIYLAVCLFWMLVVGLRNIVNHQLSDFENDKRSGTVTTVIVMGKQQMKQVMNHLLLPCEVIIFLLFLGLSKQTGFVLLFFIFAIWVFNRELIYVRANKHSWSKEEQDRYSFLGGILPNEFYEKWFPLYSLFFLVCYNPHLWYFLIIHVFLFLNLIIDFKKDYLILKNLILKVLYWRIVIMAYKLIGGVKRVILFLYYKIYCKTKHFIYWNFYQAIFKRNGTVK